METKLVKMGDDLPMVLGERVLRKEEWPVIDEKAAAMAKFETVNYDSKENYDSKGKKESWDSDAVRARNAAWWKLSSAGILTNNPLT
jgi:hypothetical protein